MSGLKWGIDFLTLFLNRVNRVRKMGFSGLKWSLGFEVYCTLLSKIFSTQANVMYGRIKLILFKFIIFKKNP